MYISNKQPTSVSPAWKRLGQQYTVANGPLQKKTDYSYSPTTALLQNKPLAPALSNKTQPKAAPTQAATSAAPEQVSPRNSGNVSTQLSQIKSDALGIQDKLNQQKQAGTPSKGLVGTTPNSLSFSGLVGGLVDRSQTSKDQKNMQKKLEQEAMANKAIGENARALSENYGKQIAEVGRLGAGAVAGNLSTGSNVVGSGNAAIASQSASQRMDALAAGQQAALAGTAQQLTGTEQLTNALTSGLNSMNTQQQIGTAALGNAANVAQPTQVAPGSTLFEPIGGGQVAGGLGGYVNYNTAEQVMGLISQYPDAGYRYNESLSPQQNLQMAQQAIQSSPTYQRSTFGAPGASSYLGGAQLGAAGDLTGQLATIQSQAGAAEQNFGLLLNIASQGGVNDSNVPILNTLKRNVERGAASKESVAAFNSAIQSVRAQYASILGGGTPTDASRSEAAQQIPDDVSLSALQTIADTLQAEANNRMASYQNTIQGLSSQAGGGSTGGGGLFDW